MYPSGPRTPEASMRPCITEDLVKLQILVDSDPFCRFSMILCIWGLAGHPCSLQQCSLHTLCAEDVLFMRFGCPKVAFEHQLGISYWSALVLIEFHWIS